MHWEVGMLQWRREGFITTIETETKWLPFCRQHFQIHYEMFELRLEFHWSFFLRVQLTISQHWFRYCFNPEQATSHYPNQWWPFQWRILYASSSLSELSSASASVLTCRIGSPILASMYMYLQYSAMENADFICVIYNVTYICIKDILLSFSACCWTLHQVLRNQCKSFDKCGRSFLHSCQGHQGKDGQKTGGFAVHMSTGYWGILWGLIDLVHKSHNAHVPYFTRHHSEQKCAHFCSEWCIVRYGTGALWDLCNRSVRPYGVTDHCQHWLWWWLVA